MFHTPERSKFQKRVRQPDGPIIKLKPKYKTQNIQFHNQQPIPNYADTLLRKLILVRHKEIGNRQDVVLFFRNFVLK